MKSKIFITLLVVLSITMFSSCEDNIVVDNILTNDTIQYSGVIYGKSILKFYYNDIDYRLINHEGIKVEILEENLSTFTNNKGEWFIADVPEGTYSIKFSKLGHQEIIWENIIHNGLDSTLAVQVYSNQGGTYTDIVVGLNEIAPEVMCMLSNNLAKMDIRIDTFKLTRDTIYRIDTTFNWQPKLDFELVHINQRVANSLGVNYIAVINNNPNFSYSFFPNEGNFDPYNREPKLSLSTWEKNENYYFGDRGNNHSNAERVFYISNNFTRFKLTEYFNLTQLSFEDKPDLYLHILPFVYYHKSTIRYRELDPPYPVDPIYYKTGVPLTSKIEYSW